MTDEEWPALGSNANWSVPREGILELVAGVCVRQRRCLRRSVFVSVTGTSLDDRVFV